MTCAVKKHKQTSLYLQFVLAKRDVKGAVAMPDFLIQIQELLTRALALLEACQDPSRRAREEGPKSGLGVRKHLRKFH